MRNKEVICAFYNPNLKHFDEYHKFMSVVAENIRKVKPIYYENEDGIILIIFYRHKLKRISKYFLENSVKLYEKIISGKYRHCACCGCGYLSYIPYTYRNNGGCVGKSFECEICQEYSDEFLCTIMDYSKKHGAKKTLLKLIKGKLFKNDMSYASVQNEANDLPF